jgi:hypothetical protein
MKEKETITYQIFVAKLILVISSEKPLCKVSLKPSIRYFVTRYGKITLLGGQVSCNTEMPMSQTVLDSSPSGITLLASSPVLTHIGSMIII